MSDRPLRAYTSSSVVLVARVGPRIIGMILAPPRERRAVVKKRTEICMLSLCVVFLNIYIRR
jgi:hypothetical protein